MVLKDFVSGAGVYNDMSQQISSFVTTILINDIVGT